MLKLEERLRLLEFVNVLRDEILETVLNNDRDKGLRLLVRQFCTLCRTDFAYIVLLDGQEILELSFFSLSPEIQMILDTVLVLPDTMPDKPLLREMSHVSQIGGIPMASGMILPILEHGQPLGFLELGSKDRSAGQRFKPAIVIHKQLALSYCILHKYLIASRSSKKLRLQAERTQKIFESIVHDTHDMIASFDSTGSILSINQAGLRMLAYEELPSGAVLHFLNPTLNFLLTQLKTQCMTNDLEVVLATNDNNSRFCIASFTVEYDGHADVKQINGVFKDISERIQIQRELWQANMELTTANEKLMANQIQMVQQEKLASIGQLAAGIAHEINNPLGFICSNHDLLKDYFSSLQAALDNPQAVNQAELERILKDLPELLMESDEGFRRIMKIIKSLKAFSHGDKNATMAQADINKALEDCLVVARNQWKDKVTIQKSFLLQDLVECLIDDLHQVFLNMIINAVQAMDEWPIDGEHILAIRTSKEGERAVIVFEDNGPGVPLHIRNRIFEPFYTTKPVGVGTGLGLSVVYDIVVKKHKGSLEILDSIWGGASFVIKLPLLQEEGSEFVMSL